MSRLAQTGVAVSALVMVASCAGPPQQPQLRPLRHRAESFPAHNAPIVAPTNGALRSVTRCNAKSLRVRAGRESDGNQFAAAGNVEITNVGHRACKLGGVPTVAILSAGGVRLSVSYSVRLHAVLRPAVLPVGRPSAGSMDMVWLNWCGHRPGPLKIQITLSHAGGTVIAAFNGPPAYNFVPACESAARPSKLELFAAYAATD